MPTFSSGEFHLNVSHQTNLRKGKNSVEFANHDVSQGVPQTTESHSLMADQVRLKFRISRSPSLELFYYNKPENNPEINQHGGESLQALLRYQKIV